MKKYTRSEFLESIAKYRDSWNGLNTSNIYLAHFDCSVDIVPFVLYFVDKKFMWGNETRFSVSGEKYDTALDAFNIEDITEVIVFEHSEEFGSALKEMVDYLDENMVNF